MTNSNDSKKVWIFNHYAGPPSICSGLRHYDFGRKLIKDGYPTKIFVSSAIHNSEINMINDGEEFREISDEGVPFIYIKTRSYLGSKIKRIFNMLDYYRGLFNVTRHFEKPDLIIASSAHPLSLIAGIKIAKELDIPCICEVRDLWPESFVAYNIMNRNNPVIKVLYAGEKWIYKKADRLVFTMEGGKDYIIEKHWDTDNGGPIDITKVHHINNGVDLESFHYNATNYSIDDHDLDDKDSFKVIYTGSIRLVNNLDTLIDTAQILRKHNNIKILIYGDGDELEKLADKVRSLGLKNIIFKGRVAKHEVPYVLSKADVNIVHHQAKSEVTKYGGSMNKLFEYFAASKPLISTVSFSYDLVKKYNCGIITENQEPQNIANAILGIKNMLPEEYNNFCENSKKAAQDYDFSKLANELEKIIDAELIKKK